MKVLPVKHPVDVSREVENMRLLQNVGGHPNIVSLHGVFHDGKQMLIVMELCDSSLHDWLWMRGDQAGFAAHTLCRDMWEGIAFLHSERIRICTAMSSQPTCCSRMLRSRSLCALDCRSRSLCALDLSLIHI